MTEHPTDIEMADLYVRNKLTADDNGRTTALLRSVQIIPGMVQLKITDIDGNILDRHRLEFS